MIIIDLNQIVIAAFFASVGKHTNIEIKESKIVEVALNCIKTINNQFKNEYGQILIAADSQRSWRKDEFAHYKAHRSKDREKSDVDWSMLFRCLDACRSGLKEFFPYKVICLEGAEADDVIATLAINRVDDKILIVSGDKDFMQLQKYPWVSQYDFVGKLWRHTGEPEKFLVDHIIQGDRGDGIPNILSDGNCFVLGKRQTPLTQKQLRLLSDEEYKNNPDHKYHKNYLRNKLLIDLEEIPEEITNRIMEEFNTQIPVPNRKKILSYLMKHRMESLSHNILEF